MKDDLEQWRLKKSKSLSTLVQADFRRLQSKLPCQNDSKVYCKINHPFPCGFGCQIHDMAACFTASLFLNRTMILVSKDWSYNAKGYEQYFEPLSESCVLKPNETVQSGVNWTGKKTNLN
jgi:hypothetical protein